MTQEPEPPEIPGRFTDGLCAEVDNCPVDANASQQDSDGDGVGDVCDEAPFGPEDPEDPAEPDGPDAPPRSVAEDEAGCSCASTGPGGFSTLLGGLVALLAMRRRAAA